MKKFFVLVMIALLIFLGIKAIRKINKKDGKWQVKILEPFINVRTDHNTDSYPIAKAIQDDKYYVLDIYLEDNKYVWYKINYKGDAYWIASSRENPYVQEYNNPNYEDSSNIDYKNPEITNFEEEYEIKDLESIEYDHLGIKDDNDYTVTHEVFYEEASEETGRPQFWIRYTIVDSYGNKTIKTQKIKFHIVPNKEEVKDISELTKDRKA